MYGKVFASLFHGSMVGQRDAQHVFVYLISHADRDGHVDAHPTEVSALTGIPSPDVEAALEALQEPDPNSRSTEQDGRRIERIGNSWTWLIVNYCKYLSMQDRDKVRDQTKARVQRHREKKRSVTTGNGSKRQGEGEGEGESERETPRTPPARSPRAASPLSGRIPANGFPSLPTNTNGDWSPTDAEVEAWSAAYPGIDIAGTLREMKAWLIANPTRRKTTNGMPRFVNRWLAKEQDRL